MVSRPMAASRARACNLAAVVLGGVVLGGLVLGVLAAPTSAASVAVARPVPAAGPAVSAVVPMQLPAPLPARGAVFRLYRAFFLRTPDIGGLVHWETRHFLAGVHLYDIADRFAASSEFQNRYGALSDDAFVTLVYRNVLERDPDPAGAAYWRNRLATGLSRGALMVGFSESSEYARRTGSTAAHLVAQMPPAASRPLPDHDDWLGWLNLHRDGAGLSTLTEDPDWSAGGVLHARYSLFHQHLAHDQDPDLALYTPEGHEAAQSSNLLGSGTQLTSAQAISSWLNSPGHGAWMINPEWSVTGYGDHHDPTSTGPLRWVGVLDVVRGAGPSQGTTSLLRFPADGQVTHYEPVRVFVIFPAPILSGTLAASATINGQGVAVTVARSPFGGYPSNTAVVTFASRPTTGDEVEVHVVADSQSTTWSFEVGDLPPTPPQVVSASTTPSGLIALRIAPAAGTADEGVTHQIVELWQGVDVLERVVVGPGNQTVFLHAGPPRAGLQVRVTSQSDVGLSAPRIHRY